LGEEEDWSLATAPLNGYSEITVSGEVEDKTTIPVEKNWPLLFTPQKLEEILSTQEKILSIVLEDPMEALHIAWERLREVDKGIPNSTEFSIRFMDSFIPSLREYGYQQTPQKDIQRIFVGITNAITNRWKFGGDKHHALREIIMDRTSTQQLRKRGSLVDKAARIEVKAGKTPLHVHYWICEDRSYEISNLTNNHNDATIYR
jgi:hypothetical protein